MTLDALFSKLTPLVRALLRSPLHGLASRGLLLLTVTGHRSGRRYTIPVGYQREGELLTIMVSEAPSKQWWRNYHEQRPVELLLRGRPRSGTAQVVPPGSPDFRNLAARTLSRLRQMGRVFGIDYDRAVGLRDDDVHELRRRIAIVRVTLAPAD